MKDLIGNTPMIKIKYKYSGEVKDIYVKLEYYNLTGSIKDRMAYHIMMKSYETGLLRPNMPIVEVTSGNTGISFSSLGSYFKHPVYIFMPAWVSKERIDIMKMYGAHVTTVSKEDGGFKKCLKLADSLSSKINGFRPNQFSNKYNTEAHYLTTGQEILDKLNKASGFVSGIGTGGTLMGVSKRLKEVNPNLEVIAIEPDKMPMLTKGVAIDNHKIDGIGDDFIPEIVDRNTLTKVIDINDDDAVNMAKLLSRKLGLGVGISSGANLLGCILSNINGNTVTVFPDDNKKYLSTDLSKEVDPNPTFISNNRPVLKLSEQPMIV